MEGLTRFAGTAVSELRKLRGEVITALAVAAIVAVVVDETAAVVLGISAILVATLAVLALSARARRSASAGRFESPDGDQQPGDEDPRVAIGRARLMEVASQLELIGPPKDPTREAVDLQPLISVIVPCFNDAGYVAAALESVRQQTYESWECLVVDDGSTDGSWESIQAVTGGDERFSGIRLEENVGSGAARNRGIEAARGEYIAFLDADDLLLRASLQDRVQALRGSDDPFVVGSFCAVRSESADVTLSSLPDRRHATQPRFIDFVVAGGECPFTLHAPLVSSDAVKAVAGFDESMTTGAVDWDLWYRLLRCGYVFVPSRTLGAIYRQKEGGITRSNKAGHTRASSRLIRAAFEPADPGSIESPTTYPMTLGLGDYQALLVVADRAVRFAAMALAEEDMGDMRKTLEVLEPGTWPLLERHLDWPATVGRGVARVVGLRPKHLPDLGDALGPFVHTVRVAVAEVTG